jgi:hypothetical protein
MRGSTFGAAVAITLAAVGAGAVMAAGAVSLFCFVMLGEPAGMVVAFVPMMAFAGAGMGLLSAAYLVPMLVRTNLAVSLPVVLGASVVAGVGMGMMHPLLGAVAALVAQVSAGAAFMALAQKAGARTGCPYCGFDCRGVRDELCPECGFGGPDWAVRNPGLCECCGAVRPSGSGCTACGAVNFNAPEVLKGFEPRER